jgi:positive regulator of sigma E activity
MAKFIANLVTLAIAVTLILMAIESDSVLQVFGYFWGALLGVAVIVNWSRVYKN